MDPRALRGRGAGLSAGEMTPRNTGGVLLPEPGTGTRAELVSQAMLLTPCHLPVPWLPLLGLGPCPQGCGNTEDGPGSQQAVSLGVGMGVPLCTLTQWYLLCPAQAQQGGQGVDHRQCCPHSVWRSLQALEYLTWPLLKKPETSYPHTGFGLLRLPSWNHLAAAHATRLSSQPEGRGSVLEGASRPPAAHRG